MIRRVILFVLLFLLLLVISFNIVYSQSSLDVKILADGQYVYGPNVSDFNTTEYLRKINSPLYPYAMTIEDLSSFYSINPMVLLTVLELRSGMVTGVGQKSIDNLLGYDDTQGFEQQIHKLAGSLNAIFYENLYNVQIRNDIKHLTLSLKTGEVITLENTTNAASMAMLSTLAPISSKFEWERVNTELSENSFVQTYTALFPDSNPLDESNQILAPSAPPSDLFKFPFASGDTWSLSGGPHSAGGCDGGTFSSVDFAPNVGNCSQPIPTNRWIVSPAAGTVLSNGVRCGGCLVEVDHGSGWGSYIYHIANVQVSTGMFLAQDQRIGNPSCRPVGDSTNCGACGGGADGIHAHYSLKYNGAFYPIENTTFEGWVVHGTACYNGYLEKNGQQVWIGQNVTSSLPDTIPPITNVVLNGTLGDNGWYTSAVQVTLTAADNSGGSGIGRTQYKIDNGSWQSYSTPLSISANGNHTVYYNSRDVAGNWEIEKPVVFSIDTLAPTGSLTIQNGAAQTYSTLVGLNAPATDATSGVAYLRFRDPGQPWSSWSTYPSAPFWSLVGSTGQTLGVEVQFKDHAGNLSAVYSDHILLNIYPARPGSALYRLPRSTFGASGIQAATLNYVLGGTSGQSSLVGTMNSSNYRLTSGYWAAYTAPTPIFIPFVKR